MDPYIAFKERQREQWAHFAPIETFTTPPAAQLVKFSGVRPGQRLLDVGCGTGVVSITAARHGAQVTALDLTPALLERARHNGEVAGVSVTWREGDVEALPFEGESFDVVVSQYGHMFAPRPEVAVGEMLRVLKPGGTIAFSTWPPELLIGRAFALVARYLPAPPIAVPPPALWGDPAVVRERLGEAVVNLQFDRRRMDVQALSVAHYRAVIERSGGPIIKLIELLSATDPDRLAEFRAEYDRLVSEYMEDNLVRQGYLMTRATKR